MLLFLVKVLIRGDRNVGKSSLFRRIQGLDYSDDYVATDEIQVAHITWNYKTSDDSVKVEVWDVVDKGKPKQKLDSLKLSNEEKERYAAVSLDAEFIDVYKGAHCVIFVFDITKQWTMDYVEREIEKVPSNIAVLILANKADQSHHRQVPKDKARVFAENFMASQRSAPGCAPVVACEASMRNNFGLRFVHSFLGIPFLVMQRHSLVALLEKNQIETELMHEELTAMLDDPMSSYEHFSDAMANKRRENADSLSPAVALAKKGAIATVAPTPVTPTSTSTTQQVVDQILPDSLKPIINSVISSSSTTPTPQPSQPTVVAMTGVGRGQPIVAAGAKPIMSSNM